jgi:hypothetical protein
MQTNQSVEDAPPDKNGRAATPTKEIAAREIESTQTEPTALSLSTTQAQDISLLPLLSTAEARAIVDRTTKERE